MMFNNKAQNLASPYTLLVIILLISLFTTMFFSWGSDIAGDPTSDINDVSREYIFSQEGFEVENLSERELTQTFYGSTIDSEGNLKDYALEFQFYREQSSSIRDKINDVYNIPSTFFNLFNLDISNWEIFSNIWNFFAWILIFFAIYKLLRGIF